MGTFELNQESEQERRLALVVAAAFGVAGILAITWVSMRVPDGAETMALVFPPGFTASQTLDAVARADGRVARFGGADNVVVVNFDGLGRDEIVKNTGALTALNPLAPGACLSVGNNKKVQM